MPYLNAMTNPILLRCERFISHSIDRKGFTPLKPMLWFFSQIYATVVFLRNGLYDLKILKSHKSDLFVISVGNIAAGGCGKTPFVRYLSSKISSPLAILSRGYRSQIGKRTEVISKSDTTLFGDEPVWLQEKCSNAQVVVSKNRVKGAELASSLGLKIALLDDGMQHRRLDRDIDIALLHADHIFEGKRYLPFGYLRDDPNRLKNVDLICIHHISSEEEFDDLKGQLKKYTNAPVCASCMSLEPDVSKFISQNKIGVVCAIARPQSFIHTLKLSGANIIDTLILPDHSSFEITLFEKFITKLKSLGATAVVCSEKDFIKLSKNHHKLLLPIVEAKAHLKMVFGENHINNLINSLTKLRLTA